MPLDKDLVDENDQVDQPRTIPIREDLVQLGASVVAGDVQGQVVGIGVYEIDNNPFQPRRTFHPEEIASLADSIKRHRQLQPIIVRRSGQRYQLISGERRLRAAIHAGLEKIDAVVHDADDRLAAEIALIENLQRKDLNAIEKAISFRNYIQQHQCTQDELAKRLSVDRSTVANLLRLLELPKEVLELVQQDRLSGGNARALLPLTEESQQIQVAQRILDEGWSVRTTERFVQEQLRGEDAEDAESEIVPESTKKGKRTTRTTSHQIASLEKQLRFALGTRVDIRQTARGRGRIVLHYTSEVEFDRLRQVLSEQSSKAAA
jgi:ParB family chromosome partitioning protein